MGKVKAHTNIALVKYWGKKDSGLIIPYTDSLSLTLDEFYTTTAVEFSDDLEHDEFKIDGNPVNEKNFVKLTNFMSHIRDLSGVTQYASVSSKNHVPISAGLASSASAFAALAAAGAKAAGLDLTRQELSRVARRGSGSATRSIFGGLVEWHRGYDDVSSFAEPIQEKLDFGLEMIAILLDTNIKKVSSRSGMQSVVATSPYYASWIDVVQNDMGLMKEAIKNKDINRIGKIAELNAMRMHALNMSAEPSFTYFNSETLKTIELIHDLRNQGINCYYTLDAGPNVKVIYDRKNRDRILKALQIEFKRDQLVVAHPGPGIEYIDC
ncbi:diphosphomevalonate decarboxylase [Paucilactobacillus suebicus]|nr:diphosphomevalonate decarboxylase [Paucilactobacillus suebicus]